MKPPKKPPPDNVGNVRGRIRALKMMARSHARVAAKQGGDYERALAKEMRARESQFKKLRVRLAKVPPVSETTPKKGAPKAAVTPQEPPKKRRAATVPADYDDLLDALGGL